MIKVEDSEARLPDELHPQLIARLPKYGNSVEQHLYLVEIRPGHFEYVLRDYWAAERRYGATITLPLPTGVLLAKELRKARTPARAPARRRAAR